MTYKVALLLLYNNYKVCVSFYKALTINNNKLKNEVFK